MGALQLGDINLFVVTDVHSFIASHFHADGLCGAKRCDADFGTLSSFIARVRERADEEQKDVFVFDNGDVVDGTGLSAATKIDGGAVYPLLTALPLDALNCGNHELYQDTTVLDGLLGPVGGASSFAGFWNGTYLTSNIVLSTSEKPIGSRYALLTGKHGTRLLVMGWLYDMPDHCAAVNVTPVADGVRQPWFADAMRHASHVDAVVVLAHMHYVDPLVTVLLGAIRAAVGPDVPVQFLTGHSHIRAWTRLDARAASFEAGHYGDTLGFVTFNSTPAYQPHLPRAGPAFGRVPPPAPAPKVSVAAVPLPPPPPPPRVWFGFDYLNMTRDALIVASGASPTAFDTSDGLALSARIAATRARLGLSRTLGCSPSTYHAAAPLAAPSSLWALYMQTVAPTALFTPAHNASQWFVTSTGALRYDLYAGNVTVDDVDMALPFKDTLWVAQRVTGRVLAAALRALNRASGGEAIAGADRGEVLGGRRARPSFAAMDSGLPMYVSTDEAPADEKEYDAVMGAFDKGAVADALRAASGAADAPTLVEYVKAVVPAGGVPTPPVTDTEAWVRWAGASLPRPPCGAFAPR